MTNHSLPLPARRVWPKKVSRCNYDPGATCVFLPAKMAVVSRTSRVDTPSNHVPEKRGYCVKPQGSIGFAATDNVLSIRQAQSSCSKMVVTILRCRHNPGAPDMLIDIDTNTPVLGQGWYMPPDASGMRVVVSSRTVCIEVIAEARKATFRAIMAEGKQE